MKDDMLRVLDDELELTHDQICYYKGQLFTGFAVEYFEGGALCSELQYVEGELNGPSREWYATGELEGEDNYRNNLIHGKATEWFENGELKSEAEFECGIPLSKREWKRDGTLLLDWQLPEDDPRRRFLDQGEKSV